MVNAAATKFEDAVSASFLVKACRRITSGYDPCWLVRQGSPKIEAIDLAAELLHLPDKPAGVVNRELILQQSLNAIFSSAAAPRSAIHPCYLNVGRQIRNRTRKKEKNLQKLVGLNVVYGGLL